MYVRICVDDVNLCARVRANTHLACVHSRQQGARRHSTYVFVRVSECIFTHGCALSAHTRVYTRVCVSECARNCATYVKAYVCMCIFAYISRVHARHSFRGLHACIGVVHANARTHIVTPQWRRDGCFAPAAARLHRQISTYNCIFRALHAPCPENRVNPTRQFQRASSRATYARLILIFNYRRIDASPRCFPANNIKHSNNLVILRDLFCDSLGYLLNIRTLMLTRNEKLWYCKLMTNLIRDCARKTSKNVIR